MPISTTPVERVAGRGVGRAAGRVAVVALATVLAAGAAAAQTVVHFGPNDGYRPIYSPRNVVVNGDFNLDPLVDPDNPFAPNPHVTGWTITPPSQFPGTRNSNAGVGADGRGLSLGEATLTDVAQTVATVPGRRYRLSFFFAVEGDPGNLFRAYAGDRLLWNLDGLPYHDWNTGWFSQYLTDVVAAGSATALRFEYQSPIGFQHLSNVTLVPLTAPEPDAWAMLLAGLAAVGVCWRRRARPSGIG